MSREGGGRNEWASKEQRFMHSLRIYASASDIAKQSHGKRRDPDTTVSDALWYHLVVLGRRHAGRTPTVPSLHTISSKVMLLNYNSPNGHDNY